MGNIVFAAIVHPQGKWLERLVAYRLTNGVGIHGIFASDWASDYLTCPTASLCRCSTLSPQGLNQLPPPSLSAHSMAPVGQAVAQAGLPPQRLHLLALSAPGSVKTAPDGHAMVQQ